MVSRSPLPAIEDVPPPQPKLTEVGNAATVRCTAAAVSSMPAPANCAETGGPTRQGPPFDVSRELAITNLETAADTFAISVVPAGNGPAPQVSAGTVQRDPGD